MPELEPGCTAIYRRTYQYSGPENVRVTVIEPWGLSRTGSPMWRVRPVNQNREGLRISRDIRVLASSLTRVEETQKENVS
jgi:hypothetical protein